MAIIAVYFTKMPAVSVVIPVWKRSRWLQRCLEMLSRQTFRDFEVLVIWNEWDGEQRVLDFQDIKLRVQTNTVNVGFAAAVNQGIRLAQGIYVAVLNDDAFPEPGWLAALVEALDSGADVGACASLMVFDHRPHVVQSAGIAIDRAAIAWDRWRGRRIEDAQVSGEVFGASAGAALYRRAMLERLGGFDERFFAYLEDVDLAWRADVAGWRTVYVPQAVVRHVVSATLGEGSALKRWLLGRNKIWMMVKNAPAEDIPIILVYDLAAIAYALVYRRDWASLQGRIEGYRQLKAFLTNRRPGRPRIQEPLAWPWKVPGRFT